jgi:hypothetical protein
MNRGDTQKRSDDDGVYSFISGDITTDDIKMSARINEVRAHKPLVMMNKLPLGGI